MESTDPGLGPYYPHTHHHHHHQPPPPSTTADARPPQAVYPHNSVPSAVSSPLEASAGGRRKRGRPRKYGTPEQAAAAKRLSSSSSSPATAVPSLSPPRKKDLSLGVGASSTYSFKRSSIGNTGQGFTPHVITVTAGEDINHKITLFMQQSKQETCVLSASGSISNASLRHPATSGGNITYEGRFDILSLCGSYLRTDFGGSSGGLSVCLSSHDGQIIGGGVDGPLIAAGPVQVILGAFAIEGKKASAPVVKGEDSTSKLLSANIPSLGFLSAPDSSGGKAVEDQTIMDGYQFMVPNRAPMPPTLTDWRTNNNSRTPPTYNFSGRVNHGGHHSSENGDYDF